jgi:hypothetical protein
MTDDNAGPDDPGVEPPLDPDVRALLAEPRMWEETPPGIADHVAAVVRSETAAPATTGHRPRLMPHWARPAMLGAAAVVALFFGGVAMFSSVDDPPTRTRLATVLIPTGVVPDVGGDAEFTATGSGLSIGVDAPSLPPLEGDNFYEGWVHTTDGHAIPVGTFHEGAEVELWAAVELDEVQEFTITREQAEEPESIEHRSSGDVVLQATLDEAVVEG